MFAAPRDWVEAYRREGTALGVDVRAALRECAECRWYNSDRHPDDGVNPVCCHVNGCHYSGPTHYMVWSMRSPDFRTDVEKRCGPSGRFWEPR